MAWRQKIPIDELESRKMTETAVARWHVERRNVLNNEVKP
jgi:hypothetical protein